MIISETGMSLLNMIGASKSCITDCRIIQLPRVFSQTGSLTFVQNKIHIPFEIRRVYYLYDIPAMESRGGHAHNTLDQILIAASGSFEVILDDSRKKKRIRLNQPFEGLHILPGIWREIENFSSGGICLVLVSSHFDEDDYIRDYHSFKKSKMR